jgi:short-subunit dehydrogenase
MVERRWGRIVNLGSIGSFSPAPMTAAYAATKAYVSRRRSLSEELDGTGVTVTRCAGSHRDRLPSARRDGRLEADRGRC